MGDKTAQEVTIDATCCAACYRKWRNREIDAPQMWDCLEVCVKQNE